jgi:hypothetical protein
MAKNKMKSEMESIMTPEFRASFPSLFEPRAAKPGDKAKYSIQMLFQVKETAKSKAEGRKVVDLEPLKVLVRNVLTEKYGQDRSKWPAGLFLPFRDGMEPGKKDLNGYGEGIVFVGASSVKVKPGVVHAYAEAGTNKPALLTVPSDFYGGCYARAKVNAFAWEYMGKVGVSFGLQHVQKLRDGEPFGGNGSAADQFDAIAEPAGAEAAPAAGGSGIGV